MSEILLITQAREVKSDIMWTIFTRLIKFMQTMINLEVLKTTAANTPGPLGISPLMEAARNNDASLADMLITEGADIHYFIENSVGSPADALMQAAESNAVDVARILIDHGADVNRWNDFSGMTPLMYAAQKNALETARLLIDSGANLGSKGWGPYPGQTALAIAVKNNFKEMAELLVKNGAKTKWIRTVKKELSREMKKWLKKKGWL